MKQNRTKENGVVATISKNERNTFEKTKNKTSVQREMGVLAAGSHSTLYWIQ